MEVKKKIEKQKPVTAVGKQGQLSMRKRRKEKRRFTFATDSREEPLRTSKNHAESNRSFEVDEMPNDTF